MELDKEEKRIANMKAMTNLVRAHLKQDNELLEIEYSSDKSFTALIHKGPAIFVRSEFMFPKIKFISKKIYMDPTYYDAFIEANRSCKKIKDRHHIYFESVDVKIVSEKYNLAIIRIWMGS